MAVLTLLSIIVIGSTIARAHEIEPAIVEITAQDGQLVLTAEISAEAILADIDLSQTTDTETSANNEAYDALRALSPEAVQSAFAEAWPNLNSRFRLNINNQPQVFAFASIITNEGANVELARTSNLTLTAPLPDASATIQFGWDPSLGVMVLRRTSEEGGFAGYVDPGELSEPFTLSNAVPQSNWQVFVDFIPVGFDHILPKGLDHILFVVGLFLLAASLRPLIWQVTAFTAAHTITLALASLGIVSVSGSIVEPLIAISIAYVAIENIFTPKLTRWRPALIFGFGLLHGLGFASVLADFGLPSGNFVAALLGFNVGVEVGQLVVILICVATFGYWFKDKPWYRSRITIPMSVVIAAIGLYWAYERVFLGG